MATTAGDIITASFLKIGVDNPTVAQTASALISLNNMVSGWGMEVIQPAVTQENLTLTSGTASYTIGPSGDLDTVRPIQIKSAYLRDSDDLDTPLEIIAAKDWNEIVSKTFESRPAALYFLPSETRASITFDCEPDEAYVLYIESMKPFTEFALTTTSVTLPVEYKEALVYNLAISLAEDWDRVPPRSVYERAKEMKYLISAATAAMRPAPKAKFDITSRSTYDITTNTWR